MAFQLLRKRPLGATARNLSVFSRPCIGQNHNVPASSSFASTRAPDSSHHRSSSSSSFSSSFSSSTSTTASPSSPESLQKDMHTTCSMLKHAQDPHENDFDVLIVGGGIVGAALASQLGSAPQSLSLRVGLVESAAPKPLNEALGRAVPDLRVYAMTPASQSLLEDLQVWKKIRGPHTHAYRHMQIWNTGGSGFVRFSAADVDRSSIGHIVEHAVLQSALFERMQQLQKEGRLSVLCPQSIKTFRRGSPAVSRGLEQEQVPSGPSSTSARADSGAHMGAGRVGGAAPMRSWCSLGLGDGREVRARLVVAADGANSRVRQLANVGTWGWDYDHRAVVATVKMDSAHDTAWQKFLPTGPVALLPLRGQYSSIVWSTSAAEAERLTKMDEQTFIREFNEIMQAPLTTTPVPSLWPRGGASSGLPGGGPLTAVAGALQGVAQLAQAAATTASMLDTFKIPPKMEAVPSPRVSIPLRLQHARDYYSPRVALVGDAAHSVHPLAGQGLNLGLSDVQSLSRCILRGLESGQDIGSAPVLEQYQKERKLANLAMTAVIDLNKRVFEEQWAPLSFLRNTGMGILNGLPPAKNLIVKYATGELS